MTALPVPVIESDSTESMESMDIDETEANNNQDAVHKGFQSFNKLLRFLPYSAAIPDEANRDIAAIMQNLTRAVLCRDIQIAAQICTSNLNSYFYLYGWRITKEQHIALIKLFYELLTMDTCPLNLVSDFAQTYAVFLKKPRLLTKEDITIPWRPLYDTLDRHVYHRRYTLSQTASKNLEVTLKFAIRTSNKYFPDSSLAEVIELSKPQLCPSIGKMNDTLGILSYVLPYFNPSTDVEFNEFLKFLLDIYNAWNNHASWESNMFEVLGNASAKMIGRIDWDPHLPAMYARLMKGLRLPVYFKQANNNIDTQQMKGFTFSTAARWIIGTLGNRPEAIRHLKNFLETLETYYNPLNMGRWSVPLAQFLNELVNIFTIRLKKERYGNNKDWWAEIPEDRKLTNEDIDEFVQMTSELVLDFYLDLTTCGFILKNLACIRPEKIIPAVMEKYESMVDTVTEPRKYLTTMRWVTIVLLPMVSTRMDEDNYDGRRMAIPFAMSLLPAITCNDMGKTTSALGVIHGLFNLIPIVDCSGLVDTLQDETERTICLETACLEDFGLQFIDSVISLIESKTHEDTRMADHRTAATASGSVEDVYLEKLLWAVCHRLAIQSSTKIVKALGKKILSYAFSTTLETDVSGKLFASVLQSFATGRPDVILPKLLPQLCSSIQHLVTDDMLDEEEIDKTLQFHLLLLSYVLETDGAELVKYKTELELTLGAALKLNGKKAYQYSSTALLQVLRSLISIYPLENRITEADFDDPNYLSIRDWGATVDKKHVHIKWHVPNIEELEWAKDLFLKVFIQFSEKYEGIGNVTERTDVFDKCFLKDLQVLGSAMDAMNPLLPFWDKTPFKSSETVYENVRFKYEFGLPKIEIVDPRTEENMKKTYFNMYCKIKTYLDTLKDDDTDAYVALIKGMDELVFASGTTDRRFSIQVKHGNTTLQNTLNPKKKLTRGGLVTRIFDLHNKRLKYNNNSTFTRSHMLVMEKLFELTVNRYARVRTFSQGRLCRMLDFFGSLVSRELTYLFVNKLQEGVPHDEYKGTLYTLLTCKKSPILYNSWTQIRNLWVALLRSPFSEKNSIIKCMDSICKTLSQSFMFFPYEDKISPQAMELAKGLISAKELESLGTLSPLETPGLSNIETLISELLDTAENGNIHWRQRLLCCNMLSVLIVDEVPMPKRMVHFFYDSLISSSLEIRMSALSTISWLTVMFHRKLDVVTVDTRTGLKYAPGESMHTVFQYKSNPAEEAIRCGKLEVTDETGQRLPRLYLHKVQYGYSALPTKLEVKLPPADYSDYSSQPHNIRVVLEASEEYFQKVDFVKKLLDIFTQEEKAGKSSSGSKKTRIFVMLARNNGPDSLKVTLDMLQALGKDKNEWKQRCAADIVSGILFGLKYWGEERIAKLWSTLRPIMNECLDSVTQETIAYWSESMSIPTMNRDPNMMRFMIELMKERWLNSLATVDSTSVESFKNMNFFDNTVANMHWRGTEMYFEVLSHVNKFFLSTPIPYVNVRDQLGRLMGQVFEWSGKQPVKFEVQLAPPCEPFVNSIFDGLKNLVPEAAKYLANDKDSEENAHVRKLLLKFKSILELIISACWEFETTVPMDLYRFIPLCCHFESYEPDQEVASLSGCTLSGFARTLIHPSNVNLVLAQLTIASKSASWKSRLCVVEFLKVFALLNTNIFISNSEYSDYIIGLVLNLLSDRKLEVRELASKVLSGFLHSLIVQKPMELLKKFEVQAESFARKRRQSGKQIPKVPLTSEELDAGHSAILGLCAFVETYPYDVPSFLPSILVILTTHLNDPQPIPATLRKCLSNFRRTHHDNWAVHKTKFTEDQLCILTDIFVSPCYYA